MASICKTLLRSMMKMVNSVMAMVGIAMVLYGLWMVRAWQRDIQYSSTDPWFIYTFLGTGITLCSVTCLGHMSADSSNTFCLSCYAAVIFVLLLLETAVAADVLLNSDWEKDLPEDPTGRFHDFKEFVESNFDVLKWIVLLILLAQGSSIILAVALRAVVVNYRSNYDSDDEYTPFINHHLQPPSYVISHPHLASKADA